MSKAQIAASRLRWLLFALAMLCWLAGLFWIFNQVWPGYGTGTDNNQWWGLQGVLGTVFNKEPPYIIAVVLYFGLFLLSQWFFLGPRGGWRVRLNESGRPLKSSVIIAAFMAALLTFGIGASAAQFFGWWPLGSNSDNDFGNSNSDSMVWPRWSFVLVLGVCWLVWASIFFVYWKQGTRGTQLSRMLRGLFAGSILEMLVSTPVHVMLLRNKDQGECYCESGSYTALVFGSTVLLWTFGPGLVLLFMREHDRREPLLRRDAA